MKSTFSKHWDNKGYTVEEAFAKLEKVNEAHGVNRPDAKWNPGNVITDPRGGYMVVIETK